MSHVPKQLQYTKDHEWVRREDDGTFVVGITDHAQAELTDIVFAETPRVGTKVSAKEALAVVESVKAASDIYSPVGGDIFEANEALNDNPGLINQDPYGAGWIFKIRIADSSELNSLLDAAAYRAQTEK